MLETIVLAVIGLLLGLLTVGLSGLYDKINQLETKVHLMRMERDRFQEDVTDVLIVAAGEGDLDPRYADGVVEKITDVELRGMQRGYLNRVLKKSESNDGVRLGLEIPQKDVDDA